jgi:hypothetical protein
MENIPHKKTLVALIFALGAFMTNIAFNDAAGQGVVENQTAVFPNNTETEQDLSNLEGSDSGILANDTNISNTNNTLENSLATNENQSY